MVDRRVAFVSNSVPLPLQRFNEQTYLQFGFESFPLSELLFLSFLTLNPIYKLPR